MAELLPYRAKDVFAPTDGSGNARGANMGETQQWGIALESFILNGRFGQSTLAGMTALTKASLSDGDTILVQAGGTGGVFKWVAASTEYADGGIVIASDEGGTGRWIRQRDTGDVWLDWWGPVRDDTGAGDTNSDALDAAIGYFRNSTIEFTMRLMIGVGRWYFSREHDLGTTGTARHLVIQGQGVNLTYLATTLEGQNKTFLRNGPTGTPRDNRVSFRGIHFEARNPVATVCPIILWLDDWNESMIDDCRIAAPAVAGQIPGTHVVYRAVWNCNIRDSHFLGGGDYRPQNPLTDTVRFTLTSGSAVVTASEAVFSAGDVGRDFMFGTPSGLWWGTVSTYDSTTQVTLTETAPLSMSSVQGWSGPVTASTTATDNTVTLSHDSAVSSDVGRWVVIRSAGTVNSRQSAHYAQITAYNSATSIEVSPAPPRTVSGVMIYWSPQQVVYEDDSLLPIRTNDFSITNSRFWAYRGVGMALMNCVQVKFDPCTKFHGASTGYDETARGMSQAAIIIQTNGSTFFGTTEAAGWDNGRIIVTGSDQFDVANWQGRVDKNQAIVYSEHPVGAFTTVTLGRGQIYNPQYDLTSGGFRAAGYIGGPSGVRQSLIAMGPISVGSGTNKRLVTGGRSGMVAPSFSARGPEGGYFVGAGTQDSTAQLPGSYQNGAQKFGLLSITAFDSVTPAIHRATFSFWTNGVSSQLCKLETGDTAFWAGSNTTGATTAGKFTVSVGGTRLYLDNDTGLVQRVSYTFLDC